MRKPSLTGNVIDAIDTAVGYANMCAQSSEDLGGSEERIWREHLRIASQYVQSLRKWQTENIKDTK